MFNKFNIIIPFFLLVSACSNIAFNEQNLVVYFEKTDNVLMYYLEKGMNVAKSCDEANICVKIEKTHQMTNTITFPTSRNREEIVVMTLELTFYKLDEKGKKVVIAEKKVEEYGNYIVDENFHIAGDYEEDKAIAKIKQNIARQIHDLAYKYAS